LTRRLLLSMCLCCFLVLAWGGTCLAAEAWEVKEQEVRTLLQNSTRLKEINTILQLNSTDTQKLLLKALDDLKASREELAAQKEAYKKLQADLEKATLYSKNQEDLIAKVNQSFEAYSKETNAKIRKLEFQRDISIGVNILLALKAILGK
jgi:hypothetical protein